MTTVSKTTKQAKFSRRAFMSKTGEVGIAISAGTVASCAPALAKTDADLFALESKWRAVRDAENQAGREYDMGIKSAAERTEKLCAEMDAIESQIAETPASTFDGMLIKARFFLRDLVLSGPYLGTTDNPDFHRIDNILDFGWREVAAFEISGLEYDEAVAVSLIHDIAAMAS